MDLSNNAPLVNQLNQYRPDKPSCEETVAKDMVNSILLATIEDGDYKGFTYIQAMTLAKARLTIEHPDAKGAASLGDIAKISADRKSKVELEAGESLKDLFSKLGEEPSDVVAVQEVIGHGGRK